MRVVIADDQRTIREGLQTMLGLLEGITVVAVAEDGAAAITAAREHQPDVVLMDLRMPHVDGVQATRRLPDQLPRIAVLVLTTYAEDRDVFPALRAGARGYLTKDAGAGEISAAIHAVHAGRTHLDATIQARLIAAITQEAAESRRPDVPRGEPPDDLTTREAEVLTLIARGLSNQEIAVHLVIANATVKTHINRILMKTGVRDRAQAVRYAYEHGLT